LNKTRKALSLTIAGDIFAANGFLRIARHYWLIAVTRQ